MIAWGLETFFNDKIFANGVRSTRVKTVQEYQKLVTQRDDYTRLFHEEVCFSAFADTGILTKLQVWNKHNFDGIIAPVQAVPQVPHGSVHIQ